MPQVFNIPKVEHDQLCSTLVVLFFQISLFIYFNLGPGPIRAKNNVNKQTNLEKQNNQSWAWLIMLNFGNVKNLGHKLSKRTLSLSADLTSFSRSSIENVSKSRRISSGSKCSKSLWSTTSSIRLSSCHFLKFRIYIKKFVKY